MVSDYALLYMAGLGIGNITLVQQNHRQRHLFKKPLERLISEINPEIRLNTAANAGSIGPADVVADFTNNEASKQAACEYAGKARLFVSASSDDISASIYAGYSGEKGHACLETAAMRRYNGKEQGSFSSGLIAAIALDEIRKALLGLEGDEAVSGVLNYNLFAKGRFFRKMSIADSVRAEKAVSFPRLKSGRVLVVGAGGIGTYAALNLACLRIPFDVYDGDDIDATNLNRQVLYYDAIGRNKAAVLKQRLESLLGANMRAFGRFFDENEAKTAGKKYSAVLSCVDNWGARELLSRYAVANNIVLIDAGVGPFTARLDIYNHNICLECRRGNVEQASTQPQACNTMQESNIVMCNAFAGAMMAAELGASLTGLESSGRQMLYFSKKQLTEKVSYLPAERQCACNIIRGCKCHKQGGAIERL